MFVSVITAVYNGEDFLMDCINSVLSQTYRHFEYIIVNDGSTDSTKEILDSIQDRRVKVIHSPKNSGAAQSLNIAIYHSTGEWIAVQDADDISLPDRLEEQVAFINRNSELGAVGSLIECIPGNGKHQKERLINEAKHCNRKLTKEQIMSYRFHGNPLCHGSVIFSKDLFEKVGGYDRKYRIAYDYDLWMRFLEEKYIKKVPKVLYQWRVSTDSLCHSDLRKSCLEVMKISTKYIQRHLVKEFNKKPAMLVIGSSNACDTYMTHVASNSGLSFESLTITSKHLEELTSIEGKFFDGIIVLGSDIADLIMHSLQLDGWIHNYNLFKLWNEFE